MQIASYLCPFSKKFHSCKEFNDLSGKQKAITILVTAIASLFTIPFFAIGGVAAFRAMVKKYAFKKIDPAPVKKKPDQPPKKDETTSRKVHRYAALDDGLIGLNGKKQRNLYNYTPPSIGNPKKEQRTKQEIEAPSEEATNEGKLEEQQAEEIEGLTDLALTSKDESELLELLNKLDAPTPSNSEPISKSEKKVDLPPIRTINLRQHLDEIYQGEFAIRNKEIDSGINVGIVENPAPPVEELRIDLFETAQEEDGPSLLEEIAEQPASSIVEPRKHLDELTKEEIVDYIKTLKTEIKNKNTPFLEKAHVNFLEDAAIACRQALDLHDQFMLRFHADPLQPFMDPQTGITHSSLYQLKAAIEVAKREFPGLTTLAFNDEQKTIVARLIQVILCGDSAVEAPMPGNSCCFQLLELDGKGIQAVDLPAGKQEEGETFLEYMLPRMWSDLKNASTKDLMLKSIAQFTNDCLLRPGANFKWGDYALPLGLDKSLNGNNPVAIITKVKEQYLKYLKDQSDPNTIQKLVEQYKTSRLFEDLKKEYDENDFQASSFPEKILSDLLDNQVTYYKTVEGKVVTNLLSILSETKIDPKVVSDISKSSGCPERDIEPLVRLKILELMVFMHQTIIADATTQLHRVMLDHVDSEGMHVLSVNGSSYTFDFTPPTKTEGCSFSNVTNRLSGAIIVSEPTYASQGIVEHFESKVAVAEAAAVDWISDFDKPVAKRNISPMTELRLNWQCSEGIMDFLATRIDPGVTKSQPSVQYEALLENVKKSNKSLEGISKLASNQFDDRRVFGMRIGSKPKELKDLKEPVDAFVNSITAFQAVAALTGKKDDEVLSILFGCREAVINAEKKLIEIKNHFKDSKKDEKGAKEIQTVISKLDAILKSLPEEKQENLGGIEKKPATWLEWYYSFVYETSDPNVIKWKGQKYESQILELKNQMKVHFKDILKVNEEPSALEGSFVKVNEEPSALEGSFVKVNEEPSALEGSFVIVNEEPSMLEGSFVMMDSEASPTPIQELYAILEQLEINSANENRFTQEYVDNVRDAYNEKFLVKLRRALIDEPKSPYLQQVCEILFTAISLELECGETVELFDEMGAKNLGQKPNEVDPKSHGQDPFVKRINTLYSRLKSVSSISPYFHQLGNSARGQWNRNFDPYRQGNPVHVLYHLLVGEKRVIALGMGTPTIEDAQSNATLSPEFIGFGHAYQDKGKKHLFVLNQNTQPKADWKSMVINGDETARSNLILDSQDLPEMKGAMYCIALSKNSEFYSQKGQYKKLDGAQQFKKELYNQVFNLPREESGCYIPESIRKEIPDFEKQARQIIEKIHANLFGSKEKLSVEERKIFIEEYYSTLTKFIISGLNVDSFNISCKDAIDRGAGSNAELCGGCEVINSPDGKIPVLKQKKIEQLMMARALLVRKRPPIAERVERFTECMDFALANHEKMKALHKDVFGSTEILVI